MNLYCISNLYRYVEISESIIKKYIETLSNINEEEVSFSEINKISSSIKVSDRKYTGFSILENDTLNLFFIIKIKSTYNN